MTTKKPNTDPQSTTRRRKPAITLSRRAFVKTAAGTVSTLAMLSTVEKTAIGAQTRTATPAEAHKHYEEQYQQMEAYFQRLIEQRAPVARAAAWRRDYASEEAYRRSVAPMRTRLIEILGGWPPQE